ncbi:hypothetical protein MMC09_000116 [Bachmanniomyces sp. S44760]|nr:hypothetical protein [Bachmanniomyces sp. S44760]
MPTELRTHKSAGTLKFFDHLGGDSPSPFRSLSARRENHRRPATVFVHHSISQSGPHNHVTKTPPAIVETSQKNILPLFTVPKRRGSLRKTPWRRTLNLVNDLFTPSPSLRKSDEGDKITSQSPPLEPNASRKASESTGPPSDSEALSKPRSSSLSSPISTLIAPTAGEIVINATSYKSSPLGNLEGLLEDVWESNRTSSTSAGRGTTVYTVSEDLNSKFSVPAQMIMRDTASASTINRPKVEKLLPKLPEGHRELSAWKNFRASLHEGLDEEEDELPQVTKSASKRQWKSANRNFFPPITYGMQQSAAVEYVLKQNKISAA